MSPFREYPGAFDEEVDSPPRERAGKGGGNGRNGDGSGGDGGQQTNEQWPKPKRLPAGLAPVEPFKSEFLPDALAPWVDDIANRLQCPPDYVAVTALTSLGAVIGRRIGIKPQAKTDWTEIPNVWGAFIGRPGMLKSPAMGEALKPIHRLEAEAAKENEIAQQAYAAGLDAHKLRREVKKALVRKKLKADEDAEIDFDCDEEPKEPIPVRYRTNDSTYEGLGELLISNPTGILVERDELTSLLKHLDRDDQSVARGFYLSGWSGTQPYTFDRIMRGHRHIHAVCVSVLGNTQPARIVEYVRSANLGGAGGDGLLQRFGLLAWPDAPGEWHDIDEYPNSATREKAWKAFERMAKLDTEAALRLGAKKGPFDEVPCLRFEEEAHEDFLGWRTDLEEPGMNPYLAKLRARSHEKHHPQEPSKPSKPILPVVAHGDTTAERGFEGFEGDRSRCLSVKQTLLNRLCRTFQHLASRCPDHVEADRWEAAVEDGRRFLTQWGTQADALGWTARDLFGFSPVPDQPSPSYRRLSRYDETGLIWLLHGRPVLVLTESSAAIESPTGTVTAYRRYNKPALGPIGDSLDDLK